MRLSITMIVVLLAGCAAPLPYVSEPKDGRVLVETRFISEDQVFKVCGNPPSTQWQSAACVQYLGEETLANGVSVSSYRIWAERPISFTDERRNSYLGAELLKTLGGTYDASWSRSLK